MANCQHNSEYIACKSNLDQLCEQKANCIRIRSKCDWYEYGEKYTKFFQNLEKIRAHQNKIINIPKSGKEIAVQKKINNKLFDFYNNLFHSNKRRLSLLNCSVFDMTLLGYWARFIYSYLPRSSLLIVKFPYLKMSLFAHQ